LPSFHDAFDLLLSEKVDIMGRIRSNISDYSSMHHLLLIERALRSLLMSPPDTLTQDQKLALHASISTTLSFLEELILEYPEKESLWTCVAGLASLMKEFRIEGEQTADEVVAVASDILEEKGLKSVNSVGVRWTAWMKSLVSFSIRLTI
jgi:hypothetical protein